MILLLNVAALADVQTVQELSDILVPHPAHLLDIGRRLGNVLEGVAGKLKLVLGVLAGLDIDTGLHGHVANDLLAEEVPADTESV